MQSPIKYEIYAGSILLLFCSSLTAEASQAQSEVQRGYPFVALPNHNQVELPSPEHHPYPSKTVSDSPQAFSNSVLASAPTNLKLKHFNFEGNTVFSNERLAAAVERFIGQELTFAELMKVPAVITDMYIKAGFLTSGAFISVEENQQISPDSGTLTVRVVEGKLERIEVTGSDRLAEYVQARLKVATEPVLNERRLFEALRLLQVDPLISSISAEQLAGSEPGKSILNVEVKEKSTFTLQTTIDNERSPSIGELQRQVQLGNANLLGLGDTLLLGYRNTDGSSSVNISYRVPFNPYNGTVSFSFQDTSNDIVELPFNVLDITSAARVYDITIRQPLQRNVTADSIQELAIGLAISRQESETALLGIPFPLMTGADAEGRTRTSTIRLFQEFLSSSNQEELFLRSQFNFGLGLFDATLNPLPPDSRFFSWSAQAQWLRRISSDSLFRLKVGVQIADRPLVPLEQVTLGGASTVRGYRESFLLGDNGVFVSSELRVPILASSETGTLQLISFIDVGTVWSNSSIALRNSTLASAGLGLQWQLDGLLARFEWGMPLINILTTRRTWQENGLHFTLQYNYFF